MSAVTLCMAHYVRKQRVRQSKPKTSIEQACGRLNISDSGYYRLFTSQNPSQDRFDEVKKDIARLVSRVHSASITNGTRLETAYIANSLYNKNQPIVGAYLNTTSLQEGHFVHMMFSILGKNIEVDYTIIHKHKHKTKWVIKLFEIKDGGELDTKKAMSEVRTLISIKNALESANVHVEMYIVLWNNQSIAKKSFKSALDGVHLITGRQMCKLVKGIDFDRISKDRTDVGPDNLSYIIRQFRLIVYKYDMIEDEIRRCQNKN